MYYDRRTNSIENPTESGQKALDILYNTAGGRFFLWSVAARPWFSQLLTKYHQSTLSQKDIVPFIKKHKVQECPRKANEKYQTFNDFFTRKKDITFNPEKNVLIAPADSKMRIFPISDDLRFKVKGSTYSVAEILGSDIDAQPFKNGTCVVFRLSVDDYHRYHFIDNGKFIGSYKIHGELHTVRPIAEEYGVYARNTRVINMMDTENFGRIAQIEVGALLVGKIVNHPGVVDFEKGQEKGYFEYGGSTIVMLFNKDIQFDEDILHMNSFGVETRVRVGERIGICQQ